MDQELHDLLQEIRRKQDKQGDDITEVKTAIARVDERTVNMKDERARGISVFSLILAGLSFLWALVTRNN